MAQGLETRSSGSDTTQASLQSTHQGQASGDQHGAKAASGVNKAPCYCPSFQPADVIPASGAYCPRPANEEQRQATVSCLGLSKQPRNVDPMLKSVVELVSSVLKTAVVGTALL